MSSIDPRLADRRRRVLEERARGGVRRVIWLMVIVTVIGALVWLLQSPWLSVATVDVTGQQRSDVDGALDTAGLEVGRPLLLAPVDAALEALLADPWVADAAVDRLFPDTIEIRIIEHQPVAVVESGSRATVISEAAVALTQSTEADLPTIRLRADEPALGEAYDDPRVRGAAAFFAALQPPYLTDAVLFDSDGELWAEVGEYAVRLGRPIEMAQKAAALQALLAEGQPAGAIINVIAPTRPTVRVGDDAPKPSTRVEGFGSPTFNLY